MNELNRLTIRMVGKLENFVVFNVKEKNMETHKKIKILIIMKLCFGAMGVRK